MNTLHIDPIKALRSHTVSSMAFNPKIKPFLTIDPIHPLVIIFEALFAKQPHDSFVPIPRSGKCKFLDPHRQQGRVSTMSLVIPCGTMQLYGIAGTLGLIPTRPEET
jgi:hypothetical protein